MTKGAGQSRAEDDEARRRALDQHPRGTALGAVMGGQHQILRKQLSSEAAFYEARHVGEKERPARPSVDRQHAGLGIALPCPLRTTTLRI